MTNEVGVLGYLKTVIQNGLEAGLSEGESLAVVVSNSPDDKITLIDSDDYETPRILIELAETVATQNAVSGRAISKRTTFVISIITAKSPKKTYIQNKTTNISLLESVENIFKGITENRIDWVSVEFKDFFAGDIPALASIVTIYTYIGNYDYSTE